MVRLNYPYKCRHCGVPYIIIYGCQLNSFLPVEIINGSEINDAEFDKSKHVSHLVNCIKLRDQWESVKKQITIEQLNKH